MDRCLILFGGGIIALFGAHLVRYDGAGGLAVITMAFVAGIKWRKEGGQKENPVFQIFQKIWIIFEPILFALIGTEIQVICWVIYEFLGILIFLSQKRLMPLILRHLAMDALFSSALLQSAWQQPFL